MPTFINTRPSQRANFLTKSLQSAGIAVLDLPLLEITPLSLSCEDKQKLASLLLERSLEKSLERSIGRYDVLVVVSPSAGELGCQFLNSNKNFPQVVAVGQATANKLAEFGITATIPITANNEGMLSLDCIAKLNCINRVMVWRGQGGRHLLIDELRKKGVTVDVIELYQRQLPPHSLEIFQHWSNRQQTCQKQTTHSETILSKTVVSKSIEEKPIVLISSTEAFTNWQKLLKQSTSYQQDKRVIHKLTDFNYLALGKRLSEILRASGVSYQQVESLSPDETLNHLR